jgi:hypothetical protein
MGGCRSADRDERDLTEVAPLVVGDELGQRLGGRVSGVQQLETARAVAAVGEGLRRDRADAGARPRACGRGSERPGLHRDAELAGLRVARDQRVRHSEAHSKVVANAQLSSSSQANGASSMRSSSAKYSAPRRS